MLKRYYKISCLGGCTVDDYVSLKKKKPGGGGLNASVHFKKILPTAKISVLGAIGKDKNSSVILKACKNYAILTSNLQLLNGKTSIQHIKNDSSGEKVFFNFVAGVIDVAKPTPDDLSFLATQDLLLGVLFTQIEPFLKSVIKRKWPGKVAIDFMSLADYNYSTEIVKNYINNFDIGFLGLSNVKPDL